MATRTISNAGGNWNATGTWVEGIVPTSADDVVATATSGNLVINTTANCLSLNFTNYVGTLSGSSNITVAGNVTFVAGMTITATGALTISATATLTSGGKTWTGNLTTATSGNTTFTLSDAWVVSGNFSFGNSANLHTFNGFTITIGGGLTITGNSPAAGSDGTTGFIMNGTGVVLHSGAAGVRVMRNPFTINTAGTITFDTNTVSFGGDFTYTSGTVVTTSSLVHFNNNSGTKTLATNGISFNNVTFANVATTYTLSNVLLVTGTLVFGTSNANTYTINGSSISAQGDISVTIASGRITGTTVLNINGTGGQTWSHTVDSTQIELNTNINKSAGTLTLGAIIVYGGGTFTHIAGTIDATTNNNTLYFEALTSSTTTVNTSSINWNNVTLAVTTGTFVLTTDLNINGNFSQTSGSNITINGADIYIGGDVSLNVVGSRIQGTTDFFFAGTGIWSGAQSIACNVTITGTYTLSGTVSITGNCVFTCTTGTLITTGSTFNVSNVLTANVVINTNQTLNNLSLNTSTTTLSQAIIILGSLTYLNSAAITVNGFSITIGGSLTLQASTTATGTTNLILNGTGTWSGSTLRNNLTINTSGTITIGTSIGYNTGTLTYISGTVVTTGSTLTIAASTTLDTDGITWNNIAANGVNTYTLLSNFSFSGNYTGVNSQVWNGFNVFFGGNFTQPNGTISGTSIWNYNGTGVWTGNGANSFQCNLVINTAGTLTFSGTFYLSSTSLTYTAGTVATTGSTLVVSSSYTLNTNGITWNNITFTGTSTITINSLLSVNGTMTLPGANLTFAGTSGWSVNTLVHAANATIRTHTLVSLLNYTITNNFTIIATNAARITFRSSIAASQAILTLEAAATQDLKFVNATDIDSSLGQTINSNKGTLSNATNWYRTNGTFMYLLQQ